MKMKTAAILLIFAFACLPQIAFGAGIWGPWIIDKQPTCTGHGQEHRVALQGKGGIQYRHIAPLGHHYAGVITKKPTCTKTGIKTYTCTRCGAAYTKIIPALGHKFGSWQVKAPARPGIPGEETRLCSRCGFEETRAIAALPVIPAKGFFNRTDLLIGGTNLLLLIIFAALVGPYAINNRYIRRQSEINRQIELLEKEVAQQYDFK